MINECSVKEAFCAGLMIDFLTVNCAGVAAISRLVTALFLFFTIRSNLTCPYLMDDALFVMNGFLNPLPSLSIERFLHQSTIPCPGLTVQLLFAIASLVYYKVTINL